jgi:hypothetical protein
MPAALANTPKSRALEVLIAPPARADVAGALYAGERHRRLRFLMTDNTLARLRGFWLTQLGLLGKAGRSHFRALPEGVRRAGRRYRAGASVTSLATYRTNAMRPVSSSQ